MGSFLLDLRHTLRGLRNSSMFTFITVAVLAVGIGANTSMFSLVRAVLLKPLPFDQPEELVWMIESVPDMGLPIFPFGAVDYQDLERDNRVFEGVGAFNNRDVELVAEDEPETVRSGRVTHDLFGLLGLDMALGRPFAAEEDVPRSGVAILSYRLWRERFGGDPGVLGRTLEVDRVPHTVIGVMARSSEFPLNKLPIHGQPADLFVPMGFTDVELSSRTIMHNFGVIGRLREGVGVAEMKADLDAVAATIQEGYPGGLESSGQQLLRIDSQPLRSVVVGDVERPLVLLLGAMLAVMLVVCANVANLTFARSIGRRGEMAVRAALGATRRRLLQLYLLESVVLSVSGALAGLGVAWLTLDTARRVLEDYVPMVSRATLDWNVLLFVLGLTLAVAVVFGIAPLFGRAFRVGGLSSSSARGSAGRSERALLRGIAVATTTIAVVLLVGAGLLLRSFDRLMSVDPGFADGGVLTMTVGLPNQVYPEAHQVQSFVRQVRADLSTLPGVAEASVASALPMEFRERRAVRAEGALEGAESRTVNMTWATPGFFEALGLRPLSGRTLNDSDRADSLPVVVVSAGVARTFWGREDVVGERLSWRMTEVGAPEFAEVVGVVPAVVDGPLGTEPWPHVYVPQEQFDTRELDMAVAGDSPWGRVFRIAVSSPDVDPSSLANAVVERIHRIDSSLAVSEIATLDEILDRGVFSQRAGALLVAIFAGTALLLASIGLYGVLAYATAQRRREFGLRLALGAEGGSVVRMVMLQGVKLAALGLALGLVVAVGLTRFMAAVLFDTSPMDPTTLVGVSLVLMLAAGLASFLPAWRAGRVDPMASLRPE